MIIGKMSSILYHLMELVDGERIRSFVLVPYKKAEAIKLLCIELLYFDDHRRVYRRRVKYTYRHTIRSGYYNPGIILRCWKNSKEVYRDR